MPDCGEKELEYAHIFIETDGDYSRDAHPIFEKRFGFDPSDTCAKCEDDHFTWSICSSMIKDTAEERGCKWTGSEWLEEAADENEGFIEFDKFMTFTDVIKIPLNNTLKCDGMFCVRCGDYYPMAQPNEGDKLRCYQCRQNRWR